MLKGFGGPNALKYAGTPFVTHLITLFPDPANNQLSARARTFSQRYGSRTAVVSSQDPTTDAGASNGDATTDTSATPRQSAIRSPNGFTRLIPLAASRRADRHGPTPFLTTAAAAAAGT